VVCRNDPALRGIFSPLDHPETRADVEIERSVMEVVGGGCFTPQGIFSNQGHLIGEILSLDGRRQVRMEEDISSTEQARAFGRMLRSEGMELIREAYERLGIRDEG
jgi:hydroxymethylbilane synthase